MAQGQAIVLGTGVAALALGALPSARARRKRQLRWVGTQSDNRVHWPGRMASSPPLMWALLMR